MTQSIVTSVINTAYDNVIARLEAEIIEIKNNQNVNPIFQVKDETRIDTYHKVIAIVRAMKVEPLEHFED